MILSVNSSVLPRFIGVSPYNDEIDSNEDAEFEPLIVYTEKGRDVQLDCAFSGNPAPTVFWVKLNFEDASQNEVLEAQGPVLVSAPKSCLFTVFLFIFFFHHRILHPSMKQLHSTAMVIIQ
jgi:hypothetical protein